MELENSGISMKIAVFQNRLILENSYRLSGKTRTPTTKSTISTYLDS